MELEILKKINSSKILFNSKIFLRNEEILSSNNKIISYAKKKIVHEIAVLLFDRGLIKFDEENNFSGNMLSGKLHICEYEKVKHIILSELKNNERRYLLYY